MKNLITLFLILILAVQPVFAVASKTCSSSYNYPHTHVNGQPADATKENANNTGINNNGKYACADIDLTVGLADANTITGANTFTMIQTFTLSPILSAECDSTGEACAYESVVRDTGSQTITGTKTFSSSPILSEECDATGEACPFESVVRDTGTQTVAGAKTWSDANTFSSAVTLSTTCSTSNHACPKTYIDAADSAITAGGCSGGASAPVGACTAGACYYDYTTSTVPILYYCRGSDAMTWVKLDLDQVDSNITFAGTVTNSSTTALNGATTLAGNLTISGTRTLDAGTNKWTNGATPTAATDFVIKSYADLLGVLPNDISGLTLWLKASAIAGSDGDAIGTWADSSAAAFASFTQATAANKPLLKTGANGINSQNVLRFDGTNDQLGSTGILSSLITNAAFTTFTVIKTSASGNDSIITDLGTNWQLLVTTTPTAKISTLDGGSPSQVIGITNGTAAIITSHHSSGQSTIRKNNGAYAADVATGNTSALTEVISIGERTGAADFYTGDIAEIIIYNRVLSEAEEVLVRRYLNAKYAIY